MARKSIKSSTRVKVEVNKKKNSVVVSVTARQINGRKGGLKTASKYSHEQRQAWGSKAGKTTLKRYGKDFFKHIRRKRKRYPSTHVTKKED